jgi:hypothetical protein
MLPEDKITQAKNAKHYKPYNLEVENTNKIALSLLTA